MTRREGPDRNRVAEPSPGGAGLAAARIEGAPGADLADVPADPAGTPFRHVMRRTADALFVATAPAVARLARPTLAVAVAYSMKTSPIQPVLERVQRAGFLVGCTSAPEQERAARLGFPSRDVVLSGPAPFWPGGPHAAGARALFCDSLEELHLLGDCARRGEPVAAYLGATIRLAESESRFGVPVAVPAELDGLGAGLAALPPSQKLALRFRAASSQVGFAAWARLASAFLDLVAQIATRVGRSVDAVSLGGGWFADDWLEALGGPVAEVTGRVAERLPGTSLVIVEAGKALAQPVLSLVTRVLAVRRFAGVGAEVVVDASIAELPDADRFPHRLAWRPAGGRTWHAVGPGRDTLVGRLSLEADVLARQVGFADALRAGDLLAVLDAGAYDTSLAFSFGAGCVVPGPAGPTAADL